MTLPIQDLEPDYYISVDYPTTDNGKPTPQAEKSLKTLIDLLYDKGFAAQIRPGDLNHLLVFVKLSSYKFSEEAEKDLIKNYEFGVTGKDDVLSCKLRIIYQYLTYPKSVGGCGITPNSGDWKFVTSIVPITNAFNESTLVEDLKINVTQPNLSTSTIKKTYGVEVALYFEYIKHYTFWLFLLSIIGIVSHFRKDKRFSLTFAFINLLWGTLFLASWHRREQHLVNLWGVQNSHLIEEHNSELAKVNERYEEKSTYFHSSNTNGFRFLKQLAFIPIALVFVGILVSYQLGCFCIEIFLTDIYDGPGKSLLTLLPTILISVFVPILTIVYNAVTDIIIKWENHDNQYNKNNSILVKTFVLNFLTGYVPLIITSFIYLPFAHLVQPHLGDIKSTIATYAGENRFYTKYLLKLKSQEEFKINQGRLDAQFFYFIVTNQVIQLVLKYVLPLGLRFVFNFIETKIQKKPQLQTKDDNPDESIWLHNVRLSLKLPEYNVDDDFRGLVLQFGYLIIFGPVWPLAPLVCIVFNIIFFKLDNLKLLNGKYFKPPVPRRVDSIHPWNLALFLLAWIGSVISPVVTAFYRHGTAPPKSMGQFALDKASVHVSSSVFLVLLMFVSEHGFLILSYLLFKFSSLFKSQVEWENDFVDNDIKLRHDYYSGKVKPTFKVHSDELWDKFTPQSTLNFTVPKPVVDSEKIEKIATTEGAYSTSAEKSTTTATSRSSDKSKLIAEKEAILKQKESELAELEKKKSKLNEFKNPTDSVIKSKSSANGKTVLSTIDNNKHISDIDPDAKAAAATTNGSETTAKSTTTDTTHTTTTTNTPTTPSHSGPTPIASSEKTTTTSKPSDSSTKSALSNDETKKTKTLDPKSAGSTSSKDINVSSGKGSSPIVEDKESSPSLAGSSASTPSGSDKKTSSSNKKLVTNAVNKVENNDDFKKFINDAEKEAKKSKSGLKKLFNKK
ncbi:increased sodium tolerance protein, putative [Candida dubliniensis CD36]|uniref:Ion homeostasis medaitor protein, putative n=1 Tax=Candida dubliniensis (strain CD36 / ATCC MYA-646 / CBS 7987 / NCPF 3949 / NRRL Y-17841) TaxID=573826 RepID=B9W8D7_CANDC|nr:increased sodium tolerance protein, putative [Candida dubliniensis CD36]CAX45007.1 increased sodium tolerance protein, putative [Candida dubliniensis CD36]